MVLFPIRVSLVRAACVIVLAAGMPAACAKNEPSAGTWESERLGNIFVENKDTVELRYRGGADSVAWTVTDFWQKEVDAGVSRKRGDDTVIRPRVSEVGYYLLKVSVIDAGDEKGGSSYTSFAIVRPHASADSAASPFGAMTHFAQGMSPELLPALKQIGIESIRDEHYWAEVEREKGRYAFPEKSDAYMAACRAAGVNPLVALTFGNAHYDHVEGPSTAEGFTGYANYGRSVLKRYGDQVRWVEIWNEYNGSWAPPSARKDLASRVDTYTDMLKVAYRRIKAERPDVQVLGGAAVLIPLPYFEGIFKKGGLDHMDGIVIHPYRTAPEGVDAEVAALNDLVRRYNQGKTKPIWVTETGRHSREEYDWEKGRKMYEKGRADGARYLVRQYTLLLKEGVEKIYWYLASDHGEFAGMGLLRNHGEEPSGMGRYAVTPVYAAYANLIGQLDGARFVRREAERTYTRAHVYLFDRRGTEVRVAWATRPSTVRLKASGPLRVFDLMGRERAVEVADGVTTLRLGEDALYVNGTVESVEEVTEGARVLASTAEDYGTQQGSKGWSYGYRDGSGAFEELGQVETMWGHEWGHPGPGLQYLRISANTLHPDKRGGDDAAAVLRWRSPVSGDVVIEGTMKNGEEGPRGDGVLLRVSVDGRELLSRRVGGDDEAATMTFAIPAKVNAGSRVEFAVSAGGGTSYDATRYEFTVSEAR